MSHIPSVSISVPPPPHTPHASSTANPFGTPSQSSQSSPELSKATQPQSLIHALPPQSPLQSSIQSFSVSLSHIPQLSDNAFPLGTPKQSEHDELSPPHIAQSSVLLVAQSGSRSLLFNTQPLGTFASQ